jgi:hypothetical protein
LSVRHLAIDIWTFPPFQPNHTASLASKFKHLFSRPLRLAEVSVESSLARLGNSVIPLMQNVVGLHFEVQESPTPGLLELFKKVWLVLGPRLHQLSLRMGVDSLKMLADSKPSLPCLKTLEVDLVYRVATLHEPSNQDRENEMASIRSIAAFINSSSGHVETLKLRSLSSPPDLTQFTLLVSLLQTFPVLHSLSIRTGFSQELEQDLESVKGLNNLLIRASSTLKNANICILHPRYWPDRPQALAWLENITSNPLCFSQISSLSIDPANSKIVQHCISNSYK